MKNPISGNAWNEERKRIRAAYEERDRLMPYENWETNIYHPRHPVGQLFHEHNHDFLLEGLNFLNIDLRTLRVLDVGCGYGYWLRYLIEIGANPANLTGIDLSPERISFAERMNPSITWLQQEEITLPFDSESFDIVLQVLVFSSITDEETRRILADEINRVTRPGGNILWVDQRKSRSGSLTGFSRAQALEYFSGGKIIYSRPVQPRYFRRLHGKTAWLAKTIHWFTKAGCESWFLIIRKEDIS